MIFIKILTNFYLLHLSLLGVIIINILIILNLITRYFIIIISWIICIASDIRFKIIKPLIILGVTKLTGCKTTLVLVVCLIYPLLHEIILQFLTIIKIFLRMDGVVCHFIWYFLFQIVKLFKFLVLRVFILFVFLFF